MISQIVISKRGGRQKLPLVFTEQGVAMLSGVLNTVRAIEVNISIMRTFVQVRQLIEGNTALAQKIKELEKLMSEGFDDHDKKFEIIFDAMRQLMNPPNPPRKKIGFKIGKK